MRIPLTTLTMLFLLAGCAGNSARLGDAARFDFGPAPAGRAAEASVAAVEVTAPSWLGGSGMQYRLSYADPARRLEYAESRWAAPPAELLRQSLDRRFAGHGGGRCRLHIELDELVQVFDSPTSSGMMLAGRAVLHASPEVAARRSFVLAPVSPTPDARGGVAAAAVAVSTLGDELAAWIAQTESCR